MFPTISRGKWRKETRKITGCGAHMETHTRCRRLLEAWSGRARIWAAAVVALLVPSCAFLPPPLWIERQGVFVYLCCVCVCVHEYWATVSYSLTCRACQVGSVVMHFVAVELNLHRFIYWEKKPQRDLEDLQRETLSGSRAGSITTNSSYTSLDKKLQ